MNDEQLNRDFAPEIVVLYCQHSTAGDADLTAASNDAKGFKLRTVLLPCSSKIEAPHILKIIEEGADGVEVIGCPDEQCKFLDGSNRAQKRVNYARGLLDEISMGADRLGMERGKNLTADEIMEIAGRRADAVRPLGPNPMKGAGGK